MIDWSRVLTKEEQDYQDKKTLTSKIATERYRVECGGILVDGLKISTDDRSKLLISGAALEAIIDSNYVLKWKVGENFIFLTGEQIINIARKIRHHVQSCFDREAELLELLNSGNFNEEMLMEGWSDLV